MKDVILFTTQTCPHCKTAKAFLRQNHIQFVEKDVNVDVAAQRKMARRGIRGVPTFIIGDDAVIGLDQAKVLGWSIIGWWPVRIVRPECEPPVIRAKSPSVALNVKPALKQNNKFNIMKEITQ